MPNCSVDLLGSVHPGQTLQVELCMPNNTKQTSLYAESHNTDLPKSACTIAQQSPLFSTITNNSKMFNFPIVAESEQKCELFLAVSPCLYNIYEA